MKKQVISDLLIARSGLCAQIVLSVIVGVFCSVVCDLFFMAFSCPYAILSFSYCVGLPLFDEQNNWQECRLAMPFSREQIVKGRYASALVFMLIGLACGLISVMVSLGIALCIPGLTGSQDFMVETVAVLQSGMVDDVVVGIFVAGTAITVMLLFCNAVQYPLAFKFGMGKAGRYIPICVAFLIACFVALASVFDTEVIVVDLLTQSPIALGLIGLLIGFVVYGISLVLSIRFYAVREL